MDKLLRLCAPAAILIFTVYQIVNRFVVNISDAVAWPVLIICIALMITGIACNGWYWGNGKNTFDTNI